MRSYRDPPFFHPFSWGVARLGQTVRGSARQGAVGCGRAWHGWAWQGRGRPAGAPSARLAFPDDFPPTERELPRDRRFGAVVSPHLDPRDAGIVDLDRAGYVSHRGKVHQPVIVVDGLAHGAPRMSCRSASSRACFLSSTPMTASRAGPVEELDRLHEEMRDVAAREGEPPPL